MKRTEAPRTTSGQALFANRNIGVSGRLRRGGCIASLATEHLQRRCALRHLPPSLPGLTRGSIFYEESWMAGSSSAMTPRVVS